MSAAFWGARGSTPVCGAEYGTFGGSTTCIEIESGPSRAIIDAGSGLHGLGRKLGGLAEMEIHILLTHYHIDHLFGLMSFEPLFRRGASVTIHAPRLEEADPELALRRIFARPFYPMRLGETGAGVVIRAFQPGDSFQVQDFAIRTIPLRHPGGACGYRLDAAARSIAVLTDYEPDGRQTDDAVAEFCRGAGLILYDSHWDEDVNYERHRGWGHSTWQAGLRLARAAGAGGLGCIHHAPDATDRLLLDRDARLRALHPGAFLAREGQRVEVGPAPFADKPGRQRGPPQSSGKDRDSVRPIMTTTAIAATHGAQPKPSNSLPSTIVPIRPPPK
jgi:phosphoribosyl 1,2-cyclic phosphodiesterase